MPKQTDKNTFINRQFGCWKVLSYSHSIKYRHYFTCECINCKNISTISLNNLYNVKSEKCKNCHRVDIASFIGKVVQNITIEKFLRTEKTTFPSGNTSTTHYFQTRCKCGERLTQTLGNILNGHTKGCKHCSRYKPAARRHNPLSNIYYNMIARCYDPKHTSYKNYGNRGIKVCDRWLGENGFNNFVTDVGERPSNLHSIDRINNDGDYSPENCRWATSKEQMNNTRLTGKLTQINLAKSVGLTREAIRQFYNAGRFPLELIEGYTVTNKPIFKPETIEYIRQGKHLQSYIKQIAV